MGNSSFSLCGLSWVRESSGGPVALEKEDEMGVQVPWQVKEGVSTWQLFASTKVDIQFLISPGSLSSERPSKSFSCYHFPIRDLYGHDRIG